MYGAAQVSVLAVVLSATCEYAVPSRLVPVSPDRVGPAVECPSAVDAAEETQADPAGNS